MIEIGTTRKQPGDIVDLLQDCHVRIRSFSALGVRIAEAEGVGAEEIREAASKVRRYFTVALPRHIADEEETTLPRLVGRDPALDEALRRMEAEHESHERPVRRLIELAAALSADPDRLSAVRDELRTTAAELCDAFAPHLEAEERIVFPAMRSLLTPEDRAAMLVEFKARRASVD